MPLRTRWTLPNLLTVGRIAVCPVIFVLALATSVQALFAAFALFVAAALTDVWDGYLARKHGWVTDMGKLLDPIADKLLLLATFIPFYLASHRQADQWQIPWWGQLPLWVMIVIFGRELAVTLLRSWASRRGTVIAAGRSGKYKALFQVLFAGGLLLWYALLGAAQAGGWDTGPAWQGWAAFHRAWVGLTLWIALLLTTYSMIDYFYTHRALLRG